LGDGCSCVDTSLGQILESLCNLLTTVDAGTRETAASLLANLARNPHTLDSVCKGLAAVLQPSDHTANRKAA
ncbi:MAG: hypothetical protein JZU63_09200, partial [Rhodoferax sp.]|nr:hypothetical protein [Rhodoferax sp.]